MVSNWSFVEQVTENLLHVLRQDVLLRNGAVVLNGQDHGVAGGRTEGTGLEVRNANGKEKEKMRKDRDKDTATMLSRVSAHRCLSTHISLVRLFLPVYSFSMQGPTSNIWSMNYKHS